MSFAGLSESIPECDIEDTAVEMPPSQNSNTSITDDPFSSYIPVADPGTVAFFTRKHSDRGSNRKSYFCDVPGCDRVGGFSSESDLTRHRRTKHNISSFRRLDRRWQCQACQAEGEHGGRNTRVWLRLDNFRDHCRKSHKNQNINELVVRSELRQPEAPTTQYTNYSGQLPSSEQQYQLPSLTRSSLSTSDSSDASTIVSSNASRLSTDSASISTEASAGIQYGPQDHWMDIGLGIASDLYTKDSYPNEPFAVVSNDKRSFSSFTDPSLVSWYASNPLSYFGVSRPPPPRMVEHHVPAPSSGSSDTSQKLNSTDVAQMTGEQSQALKPGDRLPNTAFNKPSQSPSATKYGSHVRKMQNLVQKIAWQSTAKNQYKNQAAIIQDQYNAEYEEASQDHIYQQYLIVPEAASDENLSIEGQQVSRKIEPNLAEPMVERNLLNQEKKSEMALYLGNMLEYISYNLLPYVPKNRLGSDIIDILSKSIKLSAANNIYLKQNAPVPPTWILFYNYHRYVLKWNKRQVLIYTVLD